MRIKSSYVVQLVILFFPMVIFAQSAIEKVELLRQSSDEFNKLRLLLDTSDSFFSYLSTIDFKEIQKNEFESKSGALPVNLEGLSQLEQKAISGITRVVEKRFKQLALEFVFKEFRENFGKDPIKGLFPKTSSLLLNKDPFTLFNQGGMWREAFKNDLKKLPDHALEIKPEIALLYSLIKDLQKGSTPYRAILQFSSRFKASVGLSPIQKNIVLLEMILTGLKNTGRSITIGQEFVSLERLASLNEEEFKIFMALVYAENKSYFINQTIGFDAWVSKATAIRGHCFSVLYLVNEANSLIASTKAIARDGKVSIESINNVFERFTELLDTSVVMYDAAFDNSLANDYRYSIKPVLKILSEISRGIAAEDYGKIASFSIDLIKILKLAPGKDSILTKYIGLMSDILSAETGEDMAAIMESYLAPYDVFKLKTESKFHVTVNAYAGVSGYYEWKAGKGVATGVFAPIGIEVGGKQFSIFGSIVDIGAPLTYRLDENEDVKNDPDIKIKDIFSPGISVIWRPWKNNPVCFGISGNYSPALRKVTDNGVEKDKSVLRAGISLSIDITLLSIHSSKQ